MTKGFEVVPLPGYFVDSTAAVTPAGSNMWLMCDVRASLCWDSTSVFSVVMLLPAVGGKDGGNVISER